MTAAGDHELDAVRARLAALRADGEADASSTEIGVDLARIRADLHRLAEAHAEAWRHMDPLTPPPGTAGLDSERANGPA
jgi:hypothetical protein